jgi:hypothetical protein
MLGRGLCLRIAYFCILYTNYLCGDFILRANFLQYRERTRSSLLMNYIVGSFVHNIPFRSGLPSRVDTLQASGIPPPSLDCQRRHGERTNSFRGFARQFSFRNVKLQSRARPCCTALETGDVARTWSTTKTSSSIAGEYRSAAMMDSYIASTLVETTPSS